jgi:hypothetical protein
MTVVFPLPLEGDATTSRATEDEGGIARQVRRDFSATQLEALWLPEGRILGAGTGASAGSSDS